MYEVTRAEEVDNPRPVRPHLVLLGAGASRAALPDGDASGHVLPLMPDFLDHVPAGHLLDEIGIDWRGRNFEDVYSSLYRLPEYTAVREMLEDIVFEYFARLRLPKGPTIYDELVLSLRDKDVIATFNWDPFLIQAYRRNSGRVPSAPHLIFLHGSVAAGYCGRDGTLGFYGGSCSRCGEPFARSQLLFPVAEKNYSAEPMIESAWREMSQALGDALFVTVFGYGAPRSDAAAIALLAAAWGTSARRQFEQIEVIDIREEEDLRRTWRRFIHTHHYEAAHHFRDSWIANHPRRTVEAYFDQFIDAKLIEGNPIPKCETLEDLWDWFVPLASAEAS